MGFRVSIFTWYCYWEWNTTIAVIVAVRRVTAINIAHYSELMCAMWHMLWLLGPLNCIHAGNTFIQFHFPAIRHCHYEIAGGRWWDGTRSRTRRRIECGGGYSNPWMVIIINGQAPLPALCLWILWWSEPMSWAHKCSSRSSATAIVSPRERFTTIRDQHTVYTTSSSCSDSASAASLLAVKFM